MTEPNTMSKTQLDEYRTFVALYDDSKVGTLHGRLWTFGVVC